MGGICTLHTFTCIGNQGVLDFCCTQYSYTTGYMKSNHHGTLAEVSLSDHLWFVSQLVQHPRE